VIGAGRALAGLCSGVVFGSATAWVQELSDDPAASARRSAVALSAGFAVGPAVAAVLAEWAPDPLVLPYLPHVVIGLVAVLLLWPTPETVRRGTGAGETGQPAVRRRWPSWCCRKRSPAMAACPWATRA
jgi:MFS family permease